MKKRNNVYTYILVHLDTGNRPRSQLRFLYLHVDEAIRHRSGLRQ